jgi:U1 small nuclear ribonucleoprotein C
VIFRQVSDCGLEKLWTFSFWLDHFSVFPIFVGVWCRYYCDYCDTHLTHDSPSVRKQHCAGYKHKANVRQYYQQFEEQQTQSLIDQKVKEHLGQTAAAFAQQQIGGAFHQHLSTLQSGQYKPLPAPGLLQRPSMPPSMRPPVLQPPSAPPSGYGPVSGGAPPTYRPSVTQTPASNGPTPQYYPNGNGPAQPQQQQYASSNSAPQQQYANSNSTLPPQQPYSTSSSTVQPQYTTSNTISQHQYSNGPSRPPMSSGFNGPPVYQQR